MKQKRRFSKLLLLLFPALLFLTACEAHGTFAIEEAGTINFEMRMQDDSGMMETAGITCDALKSEIGTQLAAEESEEIEVIDNSTEEALDCSIRAHSSESAVDGQTLIESGDNYIFKLDSGQNSGLSEEDLQMLGFFDYDFTFTVQMPGKIIRAEGAQISGNQAVYSDLATLINGIEVEGKKAADPSAAAEAAAAQHESQQQNEDGLSWIAIIAIVVGIILLLAIVLVVFLARRRKKQQNISNPYNTYANSGNFGAFTDDFTPQQGGQSWQQPQQTANWQQQPPQTWQHPQDAQDSSVKANEFFSAPAPQQPFNAPQQQSATGFTTPNSAPAANQTPDTPSNTSPEN